MSYLAIVLTILHGALTNGNIFLSECAKYYRPKNYFDVFPHLSMPYIDKLPIPNNQILKNRDYLSKLQKIQPSPVITTKVVSIKTKYVYKNPVCVKYTKKQKFCSPENIKNRENIDKLVTKDFFVKHSDNVEKRVSTVDSEENNSDQFNLKVSFTNLESSEHEDLGESRSFKTPLAPSQLQTPSLSADDINEMLIEDRLDQLETILPDYTRRRTYETRTIFVTKTISNRRSMATLLVKNCVPLGYDICPKKAGNSNKTKKKKRGRSSKVAKESLNSREKDFYYG